LIVFLTVHMNLVQEKANVVSVCPIIEK